MSDEPSIRTVGDLIAALSRFDPNEEIHYFVPEDNAEPPNGVCYPLHAWRGEVCDNGNRGLRLHREAVFIELGD